MATKTTNYGLTKPDQTENYDVTVRNANWDKIDEEMKANADAAAAKQSPIKAGSGISIASDGVTINHSTSISAGSVGGETAIPVITVDAQGHVTAKSTKTVYPPTTVGTSGQYWKSDGNGTGTWQTPDSAVTAGSSNLVTSGAVKTAIDDSQMEINGGASTIVDDNLTASRALISDGNGKVAVSAVTSTELAYLDGVTSNIQTQITNAQTAANTAEAHATTAQTTAENAKVKTVTASVDEDTNILTITVNGVSGTVELPRSEEIATDLLLSVVDASGNVVEGAEITFLSNDWDLSGLTLTWTGYEEDRLDGSPITLTVSGITGSFPECATWAIVTTVNEYEHTVSNNNINSSWSFTAGIAVDQTENNTATFVLRDADGNTIVETTGYTTVNNLT